MPFKAAVCEHYPELALPLRLLTEPCCHCSGRGQPIYQDELSNLRHAVHLVPLGVGLGAIN